MNPHSLANAMLSGSVGDPSIVANYVGDPNINPWSPRVGAPVEQVGAGQNGNGPIQYSDTVYVAGDVTWFGFGLTSILAAAVGQVVSIKPLRPITPQKIFCPSTNQGLLVGAASVGGTNIFANQAGVPIELFSEVSTAPQIRWPTIDTSVGIDFTLINPTGAAIPFTGAMYGTALRR